jgi:hypothetical protein
MNFNDLSLAERLVAEQAVLNLQTLNTACDNAADGTVLAIAETLAVEQGREFTRKTLQMSIAAQVKTVEEKFAPRTCQCGMKKAHHGRKIREQMTSAGEVRLSRIADSDPIRIFCSDPSVSVPSHLGKLPSERHVLPLL